MWGAILASAGASLLGANMQADAAEDAANTQANAANSATAEQRRQFDLSRADLSPYRKAGGAAVDKLSSMLGLGGASVYNRVLPNGQSVRDAWEAYIDSTNLPGNVPLSQLREVDPASYNRLMAGWEPYASTFAQNQGLDLSKPDEDAGSLLRKFSTSDFANDPVIKKSFEFGLSEGEKAVRRMFGAKGLARSGAAVKAAARFATDYTGQQAGASRDRYVQDQTNTYNRLAGVAGTGQTAATNTAQLGAEMSRSAGDMMVGTANARGAAGIAAANAYGNAFGNIGNSIQRRFMLDDLTNRGYVPPVLPSVAGQFNLDTYG